MRGMGGSSLCLGLGPPLLPNLGSWDGAMYATALKSHVLIGRRLGCGGVW